MRREVSEAIFEYRSAIETATIANVRAASCGTRYDWEVVRRTEEAAERAEEALVRAILAAQVAS